MNILIMNIFIITPRHIYHSVIFDPIPITAPPQIKIIFSMRQKTDLVAPNPQKRRILLLQINKLITYRTQQPVLCKDICTIRILLRIHHRLSHHQFHRLITHRLLISTKRMRHCSMFSCLLLQILKSHSSNRKKDRILTRNVQSTTNRALNTTTLLPRF